MFVNLTTESQVNECGVAVKCASYLPPAPISDLVPYYSNISNNTRPPLLPLTSRSYQQSSSFVRVVLEASARAYLFTTFFKNSGFVISTWTSESKRVSSQSRFLHNGKKIAMYC